MRDAPLLDRGSERAHDVILAHHVRERARTVGAVERGHGGSLFATGASDSVTGPEGASDGQRLDGRRLVPGLTTSPEQDR